MKKVKFNVFVTKFIDSNRFIHEKNIIDGFAYRSTQFPDIMLVVHKRIRSTHWTVSEWETGSSIGVYGKTKKDAITQADSVIISKGVEVLLRGLSLCLYSYGQANDPKDFPVNL